MTPNAMPYQQMYLSCLAEDKGEPQQTFVLMKTSWRRLSSSSSEDVLKTSSRRLGQEQYIRLGYTSSRRLQDVFKTFSKKKKKCLEDVFKSFSRRLGRRKIVALKTYWRLPQDVLKTNKCLLRINKIWFNCIMLS